MLEPEVLVLKLNPGGLSCSGATISYVRAQQQESAFGSEAERVLSLIWRNAIFGHGSTPSSDASYSRRSRLLCRLHNSDRSAGKNWDGMRLMGSGTSRL